MAGARGQLWLIPPAPPARPDPQLVVGHSEGFSAYTVIEVF